MELSIRWKVTIKYI